MKDIDKENIFGCFKEIGTVKMKQFFINCFGIFLLLKNIRINYNGSLPTKGVERQKKLNLFYLDHIIFHI